ncbi:MAG: hypothetical protein ISR65_15630 [Bacteriovoracaceae bacterium]|nr:hypothetical protein [Bacteriovoracaceae bacterium]
MSEELTYFQFNAECNGQIYIKCDLELFNESLESFLEECRFTKLEENEVKDIEEQIEESSNVRILSMVNATPAISRQIELARDSDKYNAESIVPKPGHKIYRFKKQGIMIYSISSKRWELGTYSDFGSQEKLFESRSIIARFLGWSLAQLGIIGFWGEAIENGFYVQRQNDAQGKAVYIDIVNNKVFTQEGVKKIGERFLFIRSSSVRLSANGDRGITMSREELLSFLSTHCTYFDYEGLSVPIRQIIQTLSKITQGKVLFQEIVRQRTNLSL